MRAWRGAPADRQIGAALVGIGLAPFAVALAVDSAGDAAPPFPCAFRELTGLPCPLCGSTRAFALAAHGDTAFLEFNAVWVAVAVATILTGAVILLFRRRPTVRITPAIPWAAGAVAATAWAWALAHRADIVT